MKIAMIPSWQPTRLTPAAFLVAGLLLAAAPATAQSAPTAGRNQGWLPVPTPVRYVVDDAGTRRLAPAQPDAAGAAELRVLRLEIDVYPTLVAVRGELELGNDAEAPASGPLGLMVPSFEADIPLQEVAIRVNDQPVTPERRLVAVADDAAEEGATVNAWHVIELPKPAPAEIKVAFRYAVVFTGGPWLTCGRHGKEAVWCRRHLVHVGLGALGAYKRPLGPRDVTVRLHGVERRWVLADSALTTGERSAARAVGLVAVDVNETTLRWSLLAGAGEDRDVELAMALPADVAADMLGQTAPYDVKALSPALQLWDRLARFAAGHGPTADGESDPLPFLAPSRSQWRELVEGLKELADGGGPEVGPLAEALLADLHHAAAWQAAGTQPEGPLGALPDPGTLPANARRTLRWLAGTRALERRPGPPWEAWDGGAPQAKRPEPPANAPWHVGTPLQRFPDESAIHYPLAALESAAQRSHLTLLVFFVVPGVLLLALLIVLIVRGRRRRRLMG